MHEKIIQLEKELDRKNHELHAVRAAYGVRFEVFQSKLQFTTANHRVLLNKPEIFKGETTDSLDSFFEHMDLYLVKIPEQMKRNVAVSFLGGHAFDWFRVTCNVEEITRWSVLKKKLELRFEPINKVKIARYKLDRWKHTTSVTVCNETFMKIIINIVHFN